ncbi:TPA: hypothetical protein HNC51_26305 [Escherichia coli]|nr:hypothetical protein [Escherichia coli]HAJ6687736.1 hypothetical protein [Escherichia coli]
MMSLWDALRMNMMISYQELVRTFPKIAVVDLVEKGEEETACDSDCSPLPEQRIREREPQF